MGEQLQEKILDWQVSDSFIKELLQRAENVDCVSFDIFDTAITRVIETPSMVFAMLEKRLSKKYGRAVYGFGKSRVEAELNARDDVWRKYSVTEVDLREIYKKIKLQNKYSNEIVDQAMSLEVDCELDLLFGNPDILTAASMLRDRGKKVIFVSDIYHSKETIIRMLTQCGYKIWDDLVVSSEHKKTKADGSIWPVVIDKYSSLLHVGDNLESDVNKPINAGVSTFHYSRAVSLIRPVVKPEIGQLRLANIIRQSEISSQSKWNPKPLNESQIFERLGATMGAVAVGAFVQDIRAQATKHGIDRLYFCSRDGFLVKQAWEALELHQNCTAKTSYLHVSRRPLALACGFLSCVGDRLSTDVLDFITHGANGFSFDRVLARSGLLDNASLVNAIKSKYGSLSTVFDWLEHADSFRDILQTEAKTIQECFEPHYHLMVDYLRQEGFFTAKAPGIVDLGWHGSMQKNLCLIGKTINRGFKIKGFYFGLWPHAWQNRFAAGFMHSTVASEFRSLAEQAAIHEAVDTLEELFSAPHGSVLDYQNIEGVIEPVFAENSKEKSQHKRIVEVFQTSTVKALKETKGHSTITESDMTPDNAYRIVERIFLSPTYDELRAISSLGHCSSYDHSDLTPIICSKPEGNNEEKARQLRESSWRVGTAKQWIKSANTDEKDDLKRIICDELSHLEPALISNL